MATLFINAHPQPHRPSHTRSLQEYFAKQWQAFNPDETPTLLNLAETDVPRLDDQTLTLFAKQAGGETLTAEEEKLAEKMTALLEQFKAHKRIVIASRCTISTSRPNSKTIWTTSLSPATLSNTCPAVLSG